MFLLRGITDRKIQKLIVAMLNKQRLSQQWSRCVPLFSWDPALASAAQAWADQCALVEYIGTTTHGETFFPPYSYPKPSLKIRTASATFGADRSMLRENGQKNIFFRNKTFLFFKIES